MASQRYDRAGDAGNPALGGTRGTYATRGEADKPPQGDSYLKLLYKQPDSDASRLLTYPVKDKKGRWTDASEDFRFAAGVAAFGMVLRDSEHKGDANFDMVLELAEEGVGRDVLGYRRDFIELVRVAKALF